MKELMENVHGMFFRCHFSKHCELIEVNGACQELTGYLAEEFIEEKVIDFQNLVYLEDKKWLDIKRQEQIDNGLPVVNEYRIVCRQGKVKWVREVISVKKTEDKKILLEGLIQDITPFKSNAFMSNAFTSFQNAVNMGSIVSITDRKGTILFVNDNFVKVSKYSRHELMGKNHNIINSGYHSKSFFQDMWSTIAKGEIWRGQFRNKAKDGSIYWVDTVISPVMNERNEIEQFLSVRNVITEQKENEHNLLESEALNRSVLSSLQTNIAILDEKGFIIRVSENWHDPYTSVGRKLFVKTIGANYYDVVRNAVESGDEYAVQLQKGLNSVLANERDVYELEYPCVIPGIRRWFLLHISKFHNDITRVIVSQFDITQRKLNEEILKKSQASMAEAQRVARIGSWEHDFKTDELVWSDENFVIFGKDKSSFHPNYPDFLQIVHPEDRDLVNQSYTESVKNRTQYNVDHRIILEDGRIKYINERCETFYDANGNPVRSIGTSQDISQQMEFELMLEKQRMRYKNVVENISDGLVIDDVDGHILFANQQFLDMLGISQDDLRDFVFVDYVAPEFREAILERHRRRMAGEDVSTIFEYAGLRKDGSRRWFEARVTKIIEGGAIKGTQSAIRDITEAKEAFDMLKASEEEKTNLLKELTKRYNELMQFNYIVSHNLRAPIANLIGLSEVFELPNIDNEEKEKIIGHIRFSIGKIDELIQDLNIILAARSDINSKLEIVDFEDIIKNVKQTLERQIIDTDTRVHMNIASDARTIFSIKSYIKSILYNLVSNAIKYRSADRRPEIEIEIVKIDKTYRIKVTDNGMGIDLNRYGKDVFGLYKRFNFSVEGKGLGLNMTKAQVEALGGQIELESKPGVGSVFTIHLPVETVL